MTHRARLSEHHDMQMLPGSLFRSGNCLATLFTRSVSRAVEYLEQKAGKWSRCIPNLSYGSACTGTHMDGLVMRTLQTVLRGTLCPGIEFECKFTCELEEKKRRWIAAWDKEKTSCVFGDIATLAQRSAACYRLAVE